ncbi:hypothetical protein LF599_16770 [Pseudodesulfovibrio thermohalotolerans]|jgi:hypothetical protein|uniref:hypothetical protein n=1 Tax=Pseudodesulfovibrio thermohalotolerans TaxID=2880651 RepID=UPI0024412212|nr:hypothetical protein [Pseudodesulfovibrio thermohalotolerans]WFS62292.1 hypothetical protein LF599_16770 [Pseudodesulfovibrio thermohalotolerans]
MSITIAGYPAEGPYTSTGKLHDRSGVYTILTRKDSTEKWTVLDVGESKELKSRVENHDRAGCWDRHSKGILGYAPHYTPNKQQAGRKEIEQAIRAKYNPACGDR